MENEIKTKAKNIATAKSKPTLTNKATQGQGIKTTIQTVTRKIESTDDGGLQATALGIKTVAAGLNGIKLTGKMSENIVNGTIKTGSFVVKGAGKIKTGVTNIHAAVVKQGILKGTVPHVQIPSMLFKALKNAPVAGLKLLGKGAIATGKFVGKSALKTGKAAAKTTWNGAKSAYKGTENALESSDDIGLQGIGVGAKSTRATIKTAAYVTKATGKTIKTSANVAIKTTKTTVHAVKRIRKYGLKDTVKYAKNKMMKGAKSATKKVGKKALDLLSSMAKKALIPLIIVIVGAVAMMNMVGGATSAVVSFFSGSSGSFTEKDTQKIVEIHPYLINKVEVNKAQIANRIILMRDDALKVTPSYNIINFAMGNVKTDIKSIETDKLKSLILNNLIKTEDYVALIEPIYQSLIVAVYAVEPTKKQADELFAELFESTTIFKKEQCIEYCNENCKHCGIKHAKTSCCNFTNEVHLFQSCNCCKMQPQFDDKNNLIGIIFHCDGYKKCQGHNVLKITFETEKLQSLLDRYFCNEIKRLTAKKDKTPAEIIKLEELKENYEICLDCIADMN